MRSENHRAAGHEHGAENQHREETEDRVHRHRPQPAAVDVGGIREHDLELGRGRRGETGLAPTLVAQIRYVGQIVVAGPADDPDVGDDFNPHRTARQVRE